MEPLALGPFVIPGYVAHAVIALAPALAAAALWARRDGAARRSVVDLLSTALLIFVLLWKLGPLYTSPVMVLEDPRLLLFARGGAAGVAVGAVGAVLYLAVTLLRRRLATPRVMSALAVFAVVAAGVYGGVALLAPGPAGAGGETGEGGAAGRRPPAPEFTLRRLSGGELSLADARGRPVVLNFWATWCGPCRIETPVKKRIASELDARISFVGVNLTTSEGGVEQVREYVRELDIGYPVVLDTSGEVQQRYGIRGTPTTYLIDADGRVAHRFMGAMSYGDMMRRLNALIDEARVSTSVEGELRRQ
jgi:thiol-disulfide isomerase/thioredoxin